MAGLEVYTDDEVIQVGKQLYVSYITSTRPVADVQGSTSPSPAEWRGSGHMLQTDGADVYALKVWYNDLPKLVNYSANSTWSRLLWGNAPNESIAPIHQGLEVYAPDGTIEYNSDIRPLRVLDYFAGYWNIDGGDSLTLVDKNYGKPIMLLLGIVPRLRAIPNIIASSTGKLKITARKTNDSYGNGQYFGAGTVFSGWRYSFIVIDASGF